MDFFQINTKEARGGVLEVFPDFTVGRSKDLMVQGQSFYAIWDEEKGLWSRDEYDVTRLVDEFVLNHVKGMQADGLSCNAKLLRSYGTNGWNQFRKFMKNVSDNSHPLDTKVTFANTEVKKTDYASRRLKYNLEPGPHPAWTEITTTLYSDEERAKFEWAIGAIIAGDSRKLQKFLVFYGPGGSGKSTIMNVIAKLFGGLVRDGGYCAMFDAKALTGNNGSFAMESFKDNPLVAIQQDGDLSKIEDNTKLNSIVSHEDMRINEKYKATYDSRINAFLFMGTNNPVKITDAKSGLIRRLIDVVPSGKTLPVKRYNLLVEKMDFELGAIAAHCLEVYRSMGRNYYNGYRPVEMMFETNVFFNYIEAYFDIFKSQDGATLKQAYTLYKEYCEESSIEFKLPMYKFRTEFKNYFEEFHDRIVLDGVTARSYFKGFKAKQYKTTSADDDKTFSLVLDETTSLFDEVYAELPAQYGNSNETPVKYWTDEERLIKGVMKKPQPNQVVDTTLSSIDTSVLHFVKVPENHIVIDFDLKDDNGEKSLERNLEAASAWPATYAELSKSGGGVHLHYIYDGGDASELAAEYADGIEIKRFGGGSSLRRRLTHCNAVPVSTISSGLPFKERSTVLETKVLQSEKSLRELIARNLRKEIHPGTKPSIDFIWKILDDANKSGMVYDVTDLRPRMMAFANNSSNQALICLKTVQKMKFASEVKLEDLNKNHEVFVKDPRFVFFDVEVYPNLFIICWKYAGSDTVVRMINPSATEVEQLFQFRLIGFNNRRYDNHILWGAFMGYNNIQLYELSKKIIDGNPNAMFGEAYNLSYADIYDFSTKKQGLKKFMIELGLHHMEMDLPWDEPVDPAHWPRVGDYCVNDVLGTEATFNARKGDYIARKILAELSGLTPNDTTQKHTATIIFGKDRRPQDKFIYTDLSQEFPGYIYDFGKSTYRDEVVGEGGYVYAEPGMYENVVLLDIASMHPTSIENLQVFGEYTGKFSELKNARIAIKRGQFDEARKMLGGNLAPYLEDETDTVGLKALSDALKIAINIVYGLTSAKFDNPFRDPRNKDNIVAKRGALFMIDLKHAVQEQGFQVVHIKTDSVKIPNATPEIIQFVTDFGAKYGYEFENEGTYEKFALVNDAVYIARKEGKWDAVGAQFQHPVVYKALFSDEPIKFTDLCETKQVTQGAMYLDFNESLATPSTPYKGMHFVGRTGMFIPVHKSAGGATLLRVKDDKTYAVAGTKGYLWLEAEMVQELHLDEIERMRFEDLTDTIGGDGSITDIVNIDYFNNLVNDAVETLEKFGSFEKFVQ
jgi:hypothetical protein